jgi:hypothetical protein
MPRLIPKQALGPPPAPAPTRVAGVLRVTEDFVCQGRQFRAGEIVSPAEPLIQALHAEHPGLFEIASIPN